MGHESGSGHEMAAVDAVILDLGGVVVQFDFALAYRHWAGILGRPADEIRGEIGLNDEIFHAFERGEVAPEAILAHVNTRLGSTLDTARFVQGWNLIFLDLCPGIETVIRELASRVRLVVLSNTNSIHADYWKARYRETLRPIERMFLSHEIGARKPEPAAYQVVLDYLGLPAHRVAYFDDMAMFVEGGLALGLRAYVADGTPSIVREMERLGVRLERARGQ